MKLTPVLCLLVCLSLIHTGAHAQLQYKWITGGGSSIGTDPVYTELEKVAYMCTDDDRNVYVISMVGEDDIRTDTFFLSYAYNVDGSAYANNILAASYDCNGRLRWAKVIDAAGGSAATGMTYSSGGVYLTGCLPYENKYIGTDTVINNNNLTDFVLKIDTTGQFKWVRFVGKDTVGNDLLTGQMGLTYFYNNTAVDGNGNIHYCDFLKTGVQVMPSVVSTTGTYDLVYDPGGNMLSATRLDIDTTDLVRKLVINKNNNTLYINRNHTDTVFFDGSYLDGVQSEWLEAFNSDGTTRWTDTVTWPIAMIDIVCNEAGNLYATATGSGGVPFKIGSDSLFETSATGYSGAVMQIDTMGHVIKHMDVGFGADGGFNAICVLPTGQLALTGDMIYSASYMGDTMTNTSGSQEPMIAIFDTSGSLSYWDYYRGDELYNWGLAIATNKMGDIFLGGMVSDSLHVTDSLYFISTGGNTDFFVAKYGYSCDCTPDSVPAPHFTASGSAVMTFTYDGTGSADSVVWNFGDSTAAVTSLSPTHTYTSTGTYNVCVTAYSGCGMGKWCSEVVVGTTGVANVGNGTAITVFPDPASTQVTIAGLQNVTQLQLFNTSGICVQKQNISGASATLNISALAAGTWFIVVRYVDGSYVTKPFTKY